MNPIAIARNTFKRNYTHHEGVYNINIYLLRLLYALMFVFVTFPAWKVLLNQSHSMNNTEVAAWCMWGSYALISILGVFRPLKMLPIILFEIIYKITWLAVVAYPLWINDELHGSSVEARTNDFLWVILPIIAMPWQYFIRVYILGKPLSLGNNG